MARRSFFDRCLAEWLSLRTHLVGIVWADVARASWRWRLAWLKRSLRRAGVVGTIDRLLFRLWTLGSREMKEGARQLKRDVRRVLGGPHDLSQVPSLTPASVNDAAVEGFLRSLEPDILLVQCVSQRLMPRIHTIPRTGTFIYHEGITPEYRGVHSPFWAVANGDDDKVGFTLLKADDSLDGGPVFAQGRTGMDPLATSLGYLGHGALWEGLADVERVLGGLEAGTAAPLDVSGRTVGYYSYFPFSRWLDIRRRRRRRGVRVAPGHVTHRRP